MARARNTSRYTRHVRSFERLLKEVEKVEDTITATDLPESVYDPLYKRLASIRSTSVRIMARLGVEHHLPLIDEAIGRHDYISVGWCLEGIRDKVNKAESMR